MASIILVKFIQKKLLMYKKSAVFVFFTMALLVMVSCQKKITVALLTEKEPLAQQDRVVFLEQDQPLPQSAVKLGVLTFNKASSGSSDAVYNAMISAKKIARKNGANVVKAPEEEKFSGVVKMNLYKYEGDVLELIKREQKEEAVDSLYSYVFLKSCSLTTSNASRQWCTQLSIRTALLQFYTYPEIKDSSTFENGELYELAFDINSDGQIIGSKVQGGSNELLRQAIKQSLKDANLSFDALKSLPKGAAMTCKMNVGSYEFLSLVKGDDMGNPQMPMEITEDQMLFSVRKSTNK